MEELEKLYATIKSLQDLGLKLSPEQLSAVKDKERDYVDNVIVQRLKEVMEPLVAKMMSGFELSVSYDRTNGLRIMKTIKTVAQPRQIERRYSPKSNVRYIIRVVYPDGHVECSKRVAHTFLNVVNYAGPERVRSLGIVCMGDNLVSDTLNEDYARAQYETSIEGLYLMTCSSTEKKLEYMQKISKELGLGLRFEKVVRE